MQTSFVFRSVASFVHVFGMWAVGGLAWGCASRAPIDRGGIKVGRVVYHVMDDAPFCANDAQYLSAAIQTFETLLDRKAANWIHYHRLSGSLASRCENEVAGCADTEANAIYTHFPALAHEVVHMVTERSQEHLPYFREGLAEALGEFGGLKLGEESSVFAKPLSLSQMLAKVPPNRYDTPAATMTALLRNKGVANTLEFYDYLGTARSEGKLTQALGRLDLSLEQLQELHDDQIATGLAGYPHLRCSAEPARFDATTKAWSFDASVGCNASGHRRDDQWGFVYRRTVELEAGFQITRAVVPAGAWLSVAPCTSGTNLSSYNASDEVAEIWAVGATSAGLHTASVSVPDDLGTQVVSLTTEPLTSNPYTASANTTLRLFSADVTQLSIEVKRASRMRVLEIANSIKGNLSLCPLQPAVRVQDGGMESPDAAVAVPRTCITVNNDEVIELSAGRYRLSFHTSVNNVAELAIGSEL